MHLSGATMAKFTESGKAKLRLATIFVDRLTLLSFCIISLIFNNSCSIQKKITDEITRLEQEITTLEKLNPKSCTPQEFARILANFEFANDSFADKNFLDAQIFLDIVEENIKKAFSYNMFCHPIQQTATPVLLASEESIVEQKVIYRTPDLDQDKDKIIDTADECPNEAEDWDDFDDSDGCPDIDNDNDKVPDDSDVAPDEPETFNGYMDQDGKPDQELQHVILTTDQIILRNQITFPSGKISVTAKFFPTLDEIATILTDNPTLNLNIGGHTDNRGADSYNLSLSQKRADSILRYLLKKGKIPPERLKSTGYGEDKPIASNETPEGRIQNRRVEFLLTL